MPNSIRVIFSYVIATGLGSGYSPLLSGTAGSFAALALWLVLAPAEPTLLFQLILILSTIVLGLIATTTLLRHRATQGKTDRKAHDPGIVVIDEWAGQFIALSSVAPHQLEFAVVSFIFFRLFDILKPGPIGTAEKLPGAWGIMSDDLLAGAAALGCTMLLQEILPGFSIP